MLTNQCKICGGVLRRQTNHTLVCTCCSAVYPEGAVSSTETGAFRQREVAQSTTPPRNFVVGILIAAIILSFAIGLFPISVGLIVALVKVVNADKDISTVTEQYRQETPAVKPAEKVEKLETCDDYLSAFYQLHLNNMPLGRLGAEAVRQIQMLMRKQEAIRDMLTPGHPFITSANEAERFVLENCRHILLRLKYCDQDEIGFLRQHENYIRQKLQENAKILRDFEKLIIEITQMDDNAPRMEPHMDVLADALHNIRTYDGALEPAPDPARMPAIAPAPAPAPAPAYQSAQEPVNEQDAAEQKLAACGLMRM